MTMPVPAAPFVADLVVADVVYVHAQPVPGAVHEELTVGTVLDQLRQRPFSKPSFFRPFVMTDAASCGSFQ